MFRNVSLNYVHNEQNLFRIEQVTFQADTGTGGNSDIAIDMLIIDECPPQSNCKFVQCMYVNVNTSLSQPYRLNLYFTGLYSINLS